MSDKSLKIIFELTICERDLYSRGYEFKPYFIKAIHVVASMAMAGKSEQAIEAYLKDFFMKDIGDESLYLHFLKRIECTATVST